MQRQLFKASEHERSPHKILVVVSEDLIESSQPSQSKLLRRAVELAQLFGAELELFHVCYDASLEWPLFSNHDFVRQAKATKLQQDASLVSEVATLLPTVGLKVKTDVRWGSPCADVVLQKVLDSKCDLVLKQTSEHTYVLGLQNTVDWSLIRDTHVPVWIVKERASDEHRSIESVVSAIGTNPGSDDVFGEIDHAVLESSKVLVDASVAEHAMVHSYVAPQSLPVFADASTGERKRDGTRGVEVKSLEREHDKAVRAFTEFHRVSREAVHLVEGHPKHTLPTICGKLDADVLVMGVNDRTVWNRLWQPVAAEPVLADVRCDILFLKGDAHVAAVSRNDAVDRGRREFDLETAVVAPQSVFSDPFEIVEDKSIALRLKMRLLQSWQVDLNATLQNEQTEETVKVRAMSTMSDVNRALSLMEESRAAAVV